MPSNEQRPPTMPCCSATSFGQPPVVVDDQCLPFVVGLPSPSGLSLFSMPNTANFGDTSTTLAASLGQNATKEMPTKDKVIGGTEKERKNNGKSIAEDASTTEGGSTFCGIFCPRSFGSAIDKLFDCLMGSAHSSSTTPSPSVSSCSSPTNCRAFRRTPESLEAKIELILELLDQKPTRLGYALQWVVQLLVTATEEEKLAMLQSRVLSRICALITRYSHVEVAAPAPSTPKTRSLSVSRASLEVIKNDAEEGDNKKEERSVISDGTEESHQPEKPSDQKEKPSDQHEKPSDLKEKPSDLKEKPSDQHEKQYDEQGIGNEQLQTAENSKEKANRKRPDSAGTTRKKDGVGYGTGSTKSRWNIARTVEERALHEEHLIGLLSALIAFLWGDQLSDRLTDWEMAQAHKGGERRRSVAALLLEKMPAHLLDEVVTRQISASAVLPLLNAHLSNDSVLDVSQHMPLFQVLLELCAALASVPALLPKLVLPQGEHRKSIAKELIPQFRNNLNNYPTLMGGISEADVTFMDFIRKINDYSEVIIRLARQFERQIPAEKRVKTSQSYRNFTSMGVDRMRRLRNLVPSSTTAPISTGPSQANGSDSLTNTPPLSAQPLISFGGFDAFATVAVTSRKTSDVVGQRRQNTAAARRLSVQQMVELCEQSPSEQYREVLRELQMSTYRLLNDAGKPVHGFSFKRELRSVNPFSTTNKDRTKRIAKELASMHNSLPLNASNAIFVCMDETRCDILKVLVTGPDDTPYENGLFEFDVFFPSNYPQQPPKCSFLTTGAGKVRFNPNLYNDGKICLSILGTWEGRPEEKWNPLCSLLQVLISIQGLIFVRHPYFNEPGFEKLQGTPKGNDLSRNYNLHIENATLNYAVYEQWKNGPSYFADVIRRHFWLKRHAVIRQAERWLNDVTETVRNSGKAKLPDVDGMADGILSSQSLQRQAVRKLVEEFRNMDNPLLADAEEQRAGDACAEA